MVRESVRKFYDNYGWKLEKSHGQYQNDILHGDLSDIAKNYDKRCEARYSKYFDEGGRFFLDAGCGANPMIQMGQKFQRHVCVDLSLVGIIETRQKLGDRGLYVVADLAALPFKDQAFDGIVASYCLYQLERNSQVSALNEFYRVIQAQKNILVFYFAKYSLIFTIHRIARVIRTTWLFFSRLLSRRFSFDGRHCLYFCVANPYRLTRRFSAVEITCLRTLTRVESLVLQKLGLLGPATRLFSVFERKYPHAMLWIGSYAAIRIQKTD